MVRTCARSRRGRCRGGTIPRGHRPARALAAGRRHGRRIRWRRPAGCVVVHEAPVFFGLGAEIAARITEGASTTWRRRYAGSAGSTPYPPSRDRGDYLPDLDRVLDAVDRSLAVLRSGGASPCRAKQFRLPDVGEGLTEAEIVAWTWPSATRSRSTRSSSRSRPPRRASSCPPVRRRSARTCWCPRPGRPWTSAPRSSRSRSRRRQRRPLRRRPASAGRRSPHERARPTSTAAPGGIEPGARTGTAWSQRAPPGDGAEEARQAGGPAPRNGSAGPRRTRRPGHAPAAPRHSAPGGPGSTWPGRTRPRSAAARRRVRVLAKPPVRKLAKDLGVDLGTVIGTGRADGVITREEVERRRGRHRARRITRRSAGPPHPAAAAGHPPRTGGSRSRACARARPRRWSPARSPRRTSPSSCTLDVTATMKLVAGCASCRVRGRQGLPAAHRGQGAARRRSPGTRRSTRLGRGSAGDRRTALREPRASRRPPRAG